MASVRRRLETVSFQFGLRGMARLARSRWHAWVEPCMALLARIVRRYRRARVEPLAGAELGRAWQRLMPDARAMPVTAVEGATAFGEIHVRCPLRGTGDLAACDRLMAYDRALLAPHGARFVVLQSQAEPGVAHCRVAMRPSYLPADDLLPAHRRTRVRPTNSACS
jgi:hypothetical protein